MVIISTVESILYLIGTFQSTLIFLYNLLLTIGHVIILVVIEVFRLFNNFINTSAEVLKVLKEDFEVFQHDLLVLLKTALKWIQDSTNNAFICTQRSYLFLLSLCEGFRTFINQVTNICQQLKWGVEKSVVLFLDSLCLIGNTFMCFLSTTRRLFSMDTLSQLSSVVYSYFIHIIKLEAIFGLLVLTSITVLSIKFKIHSRMLRVINIFFLKLAISSHHGLKLFLMLFPLTISAMKRNLSSVKYVLYKYVRKKEEEELSKLSRDDLKKLLEEEKAEKLCIVCMDRKRNIILLHCQHLILCNICVTTVLQDTALCPVCRRVIFDVITVYT